VDLHGHLHWDGLFSQNPPVMDLMTVPAHRKPDELWIVQINPQERAEDPRSLDEIADRRNELSGNLSLNQELRFIEWINDWIDAGHLPTEKFSRTTVRKIEMRKQHHYATKIDRRPSFVRSLIDLGDAQAREFLAALADVDSGRSRTRDRAGAAYRYGRKHGTAATDEVEEVDADGGTDDPVEGDDGSLGAS
jgi:NTE family protein